MKAIALIMVAALAFAVAKATPAADCSNIGEQQVRKSFNDFVDTLLNERNARRAFETHANPSLLQHSPAFGKDRESTIRQYEKMLRMPQSRFWIDGVSIESGLGIIRFRGQLEPTQSGARVVAFFRFECGKIVEAWDIFDVGNAIRG